MWWGDFLHSEFNHLMDVIFAQRMTPFSHPGRLCLFSALAASFSPLTQWFWLLQTVMTTRAKPPGSGGLNNWRTNRVSFCVCDSHPDGTQGLTARDSIHNWNYLPKMPHPVCDAAIPGHLLKGWRMHLHLMVEGPLAMTSAACREENRFQSAVRDFSNNVTFSKASGALKKHAHSFV